MCIIFFECIVCVNVHKMVIQYNMTVCATLNFKAVHIQSRAEPKLSSRNSEINDNIL